MKRITIFGLALALVGCWVGGAGAALLEAKSALLVPYYQVGDNLATLIGVQHVGAPAVGQSSEIAVFVHNGDNGEIVETGSLCLAEDEFGAVILQSSRPTRRDTRREIYISVADNNEIGSTGFVTLAYEGDTSDCGRAGNQAVAGSTVAAAGVMVAWAILQDVSNGFFAAEIPVTEVPWSAAVNAVTARTERRPQEATCVTSGGAEAPSDVNAAGNGCDTATNTFVPAGEAYCYANADEPRVPVRLQLNTAENGCADPYTHTFVPRNTTLPAVPAVAAAPGVDFTCANADACPGLAINAAEMGARFDVSSFNNSISNIYVWLDTAPPDGRTAAVEVVCENGTRPTLTSSQINRIDIDGYVNVIDPAGLGCSGRGALNLTLTNRMIAAEKCYASTDNTRTAVAVALDPLNNRCYTFTRRRNGDQLATDQGDSYFCYNSTTATSTPVIGDRVTQAELTTDGVVTDCSRFVYVADVPADTPDGFIFSHITQDNDHFRINGAGYAK